MPKSATRSSHWQITLEKPGRASKVVQLLQAAITTRARGLGQVAASAEGYVLLTWRHEVTYNAAYSRVLTILEGTHIRPAGKRDV